MLFSKNDLHNTHQKWAVMQRKRYSDTALFLNAYSDNVLVFQIMMMYFCLFVCHMIAASEGTKPLELPLFRRPQVDVWHWKRNGNKHGFIIWLLGVNDWFSWSQVSNGKYRINEFCDININNDINMKEYSVSTESGLSIAVLMRFHIASFFVRHFIWVIGKHTTMGSLLSGIVTATWIIGTFGWVRCARRTMVSLFFIPETLYGRLPIIYSNIWTRKREKCEPRTTLCWDWEEWNILDSCFYLKIVFLL